MRGDAMMGDDRLREALHRLHGAVLLEARDHMPEDHGEAVHARGKGRAYENVLFLLDDMDDHEGLPDKLDGDCGKPTPSSPARPSQRTGRCTTATTAMPTLPRGCSDDE